MKAQTGRCGSRSHYCSPSDFFLLGGHAVTQQNRDAEDHPLLFLEDECADFETVDLAPLNESTLYVRV